MSQQFEALKYYQLIYWNGSDEEEGAFEEIECLIDSQTIERLLEVAPPKFIRIIVDDGEQMIFPTENINTIKEIFGPETV
ncbi:hypothetical protein [Enterococcus sp. AZ177]|uniref:hypothetical protein n=1 Tax=unclassified Enterococcus TaxID=2608891 RepID=UPI003D300FEE